MNGPPQTVEAGHEEQVIDVALATLDDRLKVVRERFSQAARHGGKNPERIHRLRVATRRASAAIDFYQDFIKRKSAGKMARCLKRVRRMAGQVRDCDLLLERFSGDYAQAEASAFIKSMQASRDRAFRDLCRFHRQLAKSNRLKRRTQKLLAKTRKKAERRPHLAVQRFKEWAPVRLRVFVSEFFQAADPDLRFYATPPVPHPLKIAALCDGIGHDDFSASVQQGTLSGRRTPAVTVRRHQRRGELHLQHRPATHE